MEDPQPDEVGVTSATITVTRRYCPEREDPEDRDVISVDTGGLTLLEALGLLEFAKATLITDIGE